jgi:hypothetical protein
LKIGLQIFLFIRSLEIIQIKEITLSLKEIALLECVFSLNLDVKVIELENVFSKSNSTIPKSIKNLHFLEELSISCVSLKPEMLVALMMICWFFENLEDQKLPKRRFSKL